MANIEDFFGEKKRDKSKCKNILDLRLRLKLINIEPDFEKLCSITAFALKKHIFALYIYKNKLSLFRIYYITNRRAQRVFFLN